MRQWIYLNITLMHTGRGYLNMELIMQIWRNYYKLKHEQQTEYASEQQNNATD